MAASPPAPASTELLAVGPACPPQLRALLEAGSVHQLSIQQTLLTTSSCSVQVATLAPAAAAAPGLQTVLKSYMKHQLEDAELQQVYREIHLHQQLVSEHVLPFYAAVDDGLQLHLLLRYCEHGDLRSLMARAGWRLGEAAVRDQVAVPLLLALQDIHARGLVHRDIKPENCLLADSRVLLGDFGMALQLAEEQQPAAGAAATAGTAAASPLLQRLARKPRRSSDSSGGSGGSSLVATPTSTGSGGSDGSGCGGGGSLFRSLSLDSAKGQQQQAASRAVLLTDLVAMHACGTPAYCAPEVVAAAFNQIPLAEAVGPQNDVWSLGVLVFEALSGRHPFADAGAPAGQVLAAIANSRGLALSHLDVSADCRDFLAAALARDPRQRWSAAQLLQHTWVAAGAAAAAAPLPAAADVTACSSAKAAGCSGAVLGGSSSDALKAHRDSSQASVVAPAATQQASPAQLLAAAALGDDLGWHSSSADGRSVDAPWLTQQQHKQQQPTAGLLGGITSWED